MTADVTVVIPTRGRLGLLRSAVAGALGQEGVAVEVVVVDDDCPDGTASWMTDRGDPRLRVIRHPDRRGVSAARNSGIGAARSRWVAFCDDDDVWAPDKLASQLAAAAESERGWAYTGEVHVDERLRLLGGGPPLPPDEAMALLGTINSIPAGGSTVVVRADVLAAVGPFDTALLRTEDWDMWLRLARTGPPAWVRRPLVGYRHHRGNARTDPRPMVTEPALLARRYGIAVDEAAMLRRAAWICLQDGRRTAAAAYYLRAAGRGDLRSLARAGAALVHPAVGSGEVYRVLHWPPDARVWAADAESWLAPLRASEHELSRQPPGRGR
jgi:glycosyltransferase involved in cell wall biosynthesis